MPLDQLQAPSLLPVLLLPIGALAVSSGMGEDTLSFAPEAGSETTKVFQESTTLTLEGATVSMGGEEQPMDQLEFEVEQSRSVSVTDVYGPSKDDMPVGLTRTYDAIETGTVLDLTDPSGNGETADIKGEHPLTGVEVKFAWDEDEGMAMPSYVESDAGEAAWLEGLTADMDLCSLLVPMEEGAKREKGERWLVDPASFLALTRPGGIGFVAPEIPDDQAGVGLFMTALASARDAFGEPTGEVEMWWKNTREINGEACAVFDLDVEVEGSADLTDLALSEILALMPEMEDEVSFVQDVRGNVALEGEGEVVWNLVQNRLHTVEIELDNETEITVAGSQGDTDVELVLLMAGETKLTVEID